MTSPRVVKLLLILAPSFKRCPSAPVDVALSLPAK
uniref:Bm13284 n=1 Tax=Brugia malayi TaxID=6279 RepID=A0A1I9G3I5_BRUMA|nr:Bm13284 [Brugia malayi]